MPKTRVCASRARKRTARSKCTRELKRKQEEAYWNIIESPDVGSVSENEQLEGRHEENDEFMEIYKERDETIQKSEPRENEEDLFPPLEVEVTNEKEPDFFDIIKGRRVVNLAHILSEYEKVVKHSLKCTLGRMKIVKEVRVGLHCTLHFYCDNCEKNILLTSEPINSKKDINKEIVWGCLSTGIGHQQCEEILALVNVPFMARKTFAKKTSEIKKVWTDYLGEMMQVAGEEEKQNAIEKNDYIMWNGKKTPCISVIVDGAWSKRSYGHGYNAPSGVAAIIGSHTKKILFLGVRNKVCAMCLFYKNKNENPKQHECVLNFAGSSTAMEQEIIVEGFNCSIEQHGVIYKYVTGDGDSSVYARIKENVLYGRHVSKIECANHMTRCVNDKLHKLSKDTRFQIKDRKILTGKCQSGFSRIERLVKGVRSAVKKVFEENGIDPVQLREKLKNAAYHVFGQHQNCCSSYCRRKDSGEKNYIPDLENSGLLFEIKKIIEPMIQKSDRLVYNQTTNQVERLYSLVAKCVGGKRVDFSKRISYTTRVHAAALSHTLGPSWHFGPWSKLMSGRRPGEIMNAVLKNRDATMRRQRKHLKKMRKFERTIAQSSDKDYGPNADEPEMEENIYKQRCEDLLRNLADEAKRRDEIEAMTQGQHDNKKWHEVRANRLTASNFGKICRLNDATPCKNTVKLILYGPDLSHNENIIYGRTSEDKALLKYKESVGKSTDIRKCGIFIDRQYPFLAASPDGLIGDRGIIEIKCLKSVGSNKFVKTQHACYKIENGDIRLKKTHQYYYQVQGQLNICDRDYCDFIFYAENDFKIEKILRDETFWSNIMVPKLNKFYTDCLLPEIVDPLFPRLHRIREPEYRRSAHEMRERKRQLKLTNEATPKKLKS